VADKEIIRVADKEIIRAPLPASFGQVAEAAIEYFRQIAREINRITAGKLKPPTTADQPANAGEVSIEFTNNTTITIYGKGTDGTVRSGTVTLS